MIGPARLHDCELVLCSRVAETARLHAWLDRMRAAAVVPERLENAVRLCLEEAVMNVIQHGYGEGRPGAVEVTLRQEPGALLATVSDSAPPFDPTSARAASPPRAGLQYTLPGGQGLTLMHRFASRLDYARSHGRNLLTLRFAV